MSEQKTTEQQAAFSFGPRAAPAPGTQRRAVWDALTDEWMTSWHLQTQLHESGRWISESSVTARLRELRADGLAESEPMAGQRYVRWRRKP